MAAGTADTELQVERVVLRIHAAHQSRPTARPPTSTWCTSGTGSRSGGSTGRSRFGSRSSHVVASELVVYNPMGILITYLQADRALVTEELAMISHLAGTRERHSSPSGGRGARPSGSRWPACTAACSPAPNGLRLSTNAHPRTGCAVFVHALITSKAWPQKRPLPGVKGIGRVCRIFSTAALPGARRRGHPPPQDPLPTDGAHAAAPLA